MFEIRCLSRHVVACHIHPLPDCARRMLKPTRTHVAVSSAWNVRADSGEQHVPTYVRRYAACNNMPQRVAAMLHSSRTRAPAVQILAFNTGAGKSGSRWGEKRSALVATSTRRSTVEWSQLRYHSTNMFQLLSCADDVLLLLFAHFVAESDFVYLQTEIGRNSPKWKKTCVPSRFVYEGYHKVHSKVIFTKYLTVTR